MRIPIKRIELGDTDTDEINETDNEDDSELNNEHIIADAMENNNDVNKDIDHEVKNEHHIESTNDYDHENNNMFERDMDIHLNEHRESNEEFYEIKENKDDESM